MIRTEAEQRGETFQRRDDERLVIVGIRRLSRAKQAALRAALASNTPAREAQGVASRPAPPHEPAPARRAPEEPEPELFGGERTARI